MTFSPNDLCLQIGEEAEQSSWKEQEKLTEGLDTLLKSGASEGEVYAQIEEFKEKFADYGRDRRTAIEFHLRNVARLLMPTTTTSVAMRALQGGPQDLSASGVASTERRNTMLRPSSSETSKTESANTDKPSSAKAITCTEDLPNIVNKLLVDSSILSSSPRQCPPTEPKALFQYLVNYLQVTPEQAAALRDSRLVAKELDSSLQESLSLHKELRNRLTQVGEDLEAEMNSVRAILSPTQAAKFLVWVGNNGACMHMLNELWSKVYPKSTSLSDEEEGKHHIFVGGNTRKSSIVLLSH